MNFSQHIGAVHDLSDRTDERQAAQRGTQG